MPAYKLIESPGNKVFFLKVKNLTSNFKQGIKQAFFEVGRDLVKTASDEIKRKKTGRVYTRIIGKRRIRIAAGAPGDYPANVTGANRRSLDFKVHGSEQLEFGADMPYSPFLEQGTSKMKARPFLSPSVKANERQIRTHMRNQLRKAFRQK